MQFLFAYSRQAQAESESNAPGAVLFGIGVLVVLLVIFLSFENADGATLTSFLSFDTSASSASAADDGLEIALEQNFWRFELKNSPPEGWDSQSH
jgi:hypothetical protein